MESSQISLNKITLNVSSPKDGGVSLNKGELVKGIVQEVKPDGQVLLAIKGQVIEAVSEVPVKPGQELFLLVDDFRNGKTYLKIANPEMLGKIENANISANLLGMGISAKDETIALARKLMQYNMPVNADNLNELARNVKLLGGSNSKNVEIAAFALSRGISSREGLTALASFLSPRGNSVQLISALNRLIDILSAQIPATMQAESETSPVNSARSALPINTGLATESAQLMANVQTPIKSGEQLLQKLPNDVLPQSTIIGVDEPKPAPAQATTIPASIPEETASSAPMRASASIVLEETVPATSRPAAATPGNVTEEPAPAVLKQASAASVTVVEETVPATPRPAAAIPGNVTEEPAPSVPGQASAESATVVEETAPGIPKTAAAPAVVAEESASSIPGQVSAVMATVVEENVPAIHRQAAATPAVVVEEPAPSIPGQAVAASAIVVEETAPVTPRPAAATPGNVTEEPAPSAPGQASEASATVVGKAAPAVTGQSITIPINVTAEPDLAIPRQTDPTSVNTTEESAQRLPLKSEAAGPNSSIVAEEAPLANLKGETSPASTSPPRNEALPANQLEQESPGKAPSGEQGSKIASSVVPEDETGINNKVLAENKETGLPRVTMENIIKAVPTNMENIKPEAAQLLQTDSIGLNKSESDPSTLRSDLTSGSSQEKLVLRLVNMLQTLVDQIEIDPTTDKISEKLQMNTKSETDIIKALLLVEDLNNDKRLGENLSSLKDIPLRLDNLVKEISGQRLFNLSSRTPGDNLNSYFYFSFPVKMDNEYSLCQLKVNKDARKSLKNMDNINFVVSLNTSKLGIVLFHVNWQRQGNIKLQGVVQSQTTCNYLDNKIGELVNSLQNLGFKVSNLGIKVSQTTAEFNSVQPGLVDVKDRLRPLGIDVTV